MNKMIAADAVSITVAAGRDDLEFMIGKLSSRCHRQRAPVQSVHAIGIDKSR
jgi:hypothetical protein